MKASVNERDTGNAVNDDPCAPLLGYISESPHRRVAMKWRNKIAQGFFSPGLDSQKDRPEGALRSRPPKNTATSQTQGLEMPWVLPGC